MALEKILFDGSNELSTATATLVLNEYARGQLTQIEVLGKFASQAGNVTSAMSEDVAGILTNIDNVNTIPEKLSIVSEVRDVFVLSQSSNANMYQTAEEVRTRLGFVEETE